MKVNNLCPKCGSNIGKDDEFCAKCGERIKKDSEKDSKDNTSNQKKKISVGDIIRYVFAGLITLGAITYFINGSLYGILELLFAASLCPFIYRSFISKFIKNSSALIAVQIVLPIVLLAIFLNVTPINMGIEDNDETNISDNNTTETTTDNTVDNTPKELSKKDKLLVEISILFSKKLAFDAGSYIKGDIPAGEYAFVKFSGGGSYYEEDDEAGNIIDNENFDSFGYVKVHEAGNLKTRGVLINVNSFNDLGVSSAKEIYEILNEKEDWNQAGYYKVGVDIESGRYVLESIGNGYWAIMTGPVGDSDIEDNDNFSGRAEVNVSDGQYLELHRAKFSESE